MGLIDTVARAGVGRAHVLVVEAPGAFRVRVALERAVEALGWCAADSVADADVLAVVGEPGPGLRAVVERTWHQMSEPRARVDVPTEPDVAASLADARTALLATEHQRAGAGGRSRQEGSPPAEPDGMSPDGIPLAEGADDRDGLEMDVLHLPLGPVLAHWPAGVVLRVTLHGDVVGDAEVEVLGPEDGRADPAPDDVPTRAARLLDAAASVLSLAGLPGDAGRARRLRDRCLDGAGEVGEIERLARLLRRRRVLRWLLGPEHDRLVDLVERAAGITGSRAAETPATDGPRGPSFDMALDMVPDLVRGQELAAVRLRMAALGPDLVHRAGAERSDG